MNKARLKVFCIYSIQNLSTGSLFLATYLDWKSTETQAIICQASIRVTITFLQNNLNRMQTESEYNTLTEELLEKSDSLSIQQIIAFQTLTMTHKC